MFKNIILFLTILISSSSLHANTKISMVEEGENHFYFSITYIENGEEFVWIENGKEFGWLFVIKEDLPVIKQDIWKSGDPVIFGDLSEGYRTFHNLRTQTNVTVKHNIPQIIEEGPVNVEYLQNKNGYLTQG